MRAIRKGTALLLSAAVMLTFMPVIAFAEEMDGSSPDDQIKTDIVRRAEKSPARCFYQPVQTGFKQTESGCLFCKIVEFTTQGF